MKLFSGFLLTLLFLFQTCLPVPVLADNGGIFTDLFFDNSPNLDIPVDFLIQDLQDGKWVRPGIGYGFEFTNHPDEDSLYLRRETLDLRLAIPGNTTGNLNLQVGPRLTAEFIRPFTKSGLKGVAKDLVSVAPSYTPSQVPHNDEEARNLEAGEYYSFTTALSLGISPSTMATGGLNYTGSSVFFKYILSGDFKVEVYKLTDDRVKVIISSLRSKSVGFGAKARFIPDLEIFGVPSLDSITNDFLNVDLVHWTLFKNSDYQLFSVSYLYDLKTASGIEAFNSLMDPRTWKKPSLSLNPKTSSPSTNPKSDLWLADLSDSLAYSQSGDPGVQHMDRTELGVDQSTKGLRWDILIADKDSRRRLTEFDYSFQAEANSAVNHYRIANLEVDRDLQLLLKLKEEKIRRHVTAIFSSNQNQELEGFDELHFFYQREDEKLKETLFQKEASAIIGQMRKMLPPEIPNLELDIDELDDILKPAYQNKAGALVHMELTLSPDALSIAHQLSPDDISGIVDAFMGFTIPMVSSTKSKERFHFGKLELFPTIDRLKKNQKSLYGHFDQEANDEISNALIKAFKTPQSSSEAEEQWETFKALQKNMIFRDFGVAILVRLLAHGVQTYAPLASLEDLLYFQARVNVEGKKEQLIQIGQFNRSLATQAILERKDQVLNRSYNTVHLQH